MKTLKKLLALALLLAAPALPAADCGFSLDVESRTENYWSFNDTLASIQTNPVLLPIPYEVKVGMSLLQMLQTPPDCLKFNVVGVTVRSGAGADNAYSYNWQTFIPSFASAVANIANNGVTVNNVAQVLRPTFAPCNAPLVSSFAHFGGNMNLLAMHGGNAQYPRKIAKGKFSLCRDTVVLNTSGVPIEIPLTVSGAITVYGSFTIDDRNYAKARLSLHGAVGGESVSSTVELEAKQLTPLDVDDSGSTRTINETRRVMIPSSPQPQTIHISLSGDAECEVQAKGAGIMFAPIIASVGTIVDFPNSITVGIPTGLLGTPLPAGVRIYDAEDGSVYVDTTANPVAVVPVPNMTHIWDFATPFDAWLGPLLPASYTVTTNGDTALVSPPGTGAGLVRRSDADADPLANAASHTAFRLAYTVHETNTTPALTVFVYDQPGGTPRALAYDLALARKDHSGSKETAKHASDRL